MMLRQATSKGACVLSRDKYRDHRRRYRKLIDDPARLISGAVLNDCLLIPSLRLELPLPACVDAAWAGLEPLLVVASRHQAGSVQIKEATQL